MLCRFNCAQFKAKDLFPMKLMGLSEVCRLTSEKLCLPDYRLDTIPMWNDSGFNC